MSTPSTADSILDALIQAKGGAVSGEALAASRGISRMAIWKAISALRADGYPIRADHSVDGARGYVLESEYDVLSKREIITCLGTVLPHGFDPDSHLHFFHEIDSTNSYARKRAAEAGLLRNRDGSLTENGKRLHGSVYIAEMQTAGRGRIGRSFFSPAGCGLYLSALFVPEHDVTDPAKLTVPVAVAVCRAIEEIQHVECGIKWVNDIFCRGKKVCGILTEGISNFETAAVESFVTGIGINVREPPDGFPDAIRSVAGAILDTPESSATNIRACLSAAIIRHLFAVFTSPDADSDILREYRARSLVIGKEIVVYPVAGDESSCFHACAVDIDENAGLVVESLDDTEFKNTKRGDIRTLRVGEVRLNSENFVQHESNH